MQQFQILQKTSKQLQNEISAGVKINVEDFLKNFTTKKHKRQLLRREKEKLAKVILSIIRIAIILIHLTEPSLLQSNHSTIITFLFRVISLIRI